MIIIQWFKWRFFRLRYQFRVARMQDGRYAVICRDLWKNEEFNASGRTVSRRYAEDLCDKLKAFKTFRDSHTEEGLDFSNPEVKAWLKRQRRRKL